MSNSVLYSPFWVSLEAGKIVFDVFIMYLVQRIFSLSIILNNFLFV